MQPLPPLDSPYAVSRTAVEEFQRHGFLYLPGVASPEEVAAYRPHIEGVVNDVVARQDPRKRREGYGALFTQVTNLWRRSEEVRHFVFARRFARIAAELMGVDGVRLYHDQALFKPAAGKGTPWHQDQFYWPLETNNTVTMWMPLRDLTRDMGTMLFASGTHREGPLVSMAISDEADQILGRIVEERGFAVESYDVAAGDATFHYGWTLHSTHPNRANAPREVMTVIYYADGARIAEPDNDYRRVDMEAFHPGQKPGELALSVLNPLLYGATAG
jgi:ectoine hydroxylase-related dioxygenase (phytanoyl-CoA dioxygenase family)